MAGEVAPALDVREAALRQQGTHGSGLLETVFQQQPSVRGEVPGCRGRNGAQAVQAVGAADQRGGRLGAQVALRKMGIAHRDVRRIRGDHVEALVVQRGKPVAKEQPQRSAGRQCEGVAARDRECRRRQLDPGDVRMGRFAGQRDGDHAAARAEVEQAWLFELHRAGEYALHQQFGLGARYQYVRRHHEASTEEFALAQDIGNRFAGTAARRVRDERGCGRRGDATFGKRHHRSGADAAGRSEQ